MRLIDADATYAHIVKSAAYRVTKAYRNKSVAEARGMKEAANMVSEAPTVDRWIKIDPKDDKTLPQDEKTVWVNVKGVEEYDGEYSPRCEEYEFQTEGEIQNGKWYIRDFGEVPESASITHWMPLPEPPK